MSQPPPGAPPPPQTAPPSTAAGVSAPSTVARLPQPIAAKSLLPQALPKPLSAAAATPNPPPPTAAPTIGLAAAPKPAAAVPSSLPKPTPAAPAPPTPTPARAPPTQAPAPPTPTHAPPLPRPAVPSAPPTVIAATTTTAAATHSTPVKTTTRSPALTGARMPLTGATSSITASHSAQSKSSYATAAGASVGATAAGASNSTLPSCLPPDMGKFGYAKLVSARGMEYFIQSPTVTLGRQTGDRLALKEARQFCPLSKSKQISRKHARIFFNIPHLQFEIICTCKNDIFVNGKLISMGDWPVPLKNESTIIVGDTILVFLLPVNFEEIRQQCRDSGSKIVHFDRSGQPPPEITDRPKVRISDMLRDMIRSHPIGRMTLTDIHRKVEQDYRVQYPKWVGSGTWKNSILATLKNSRMFTRDREPRLDEATQQTVAVDFWKLMPSASGASDADAQKRKAPTTAIVGGQQPLLKRMRMTGSTTPGPPATAPGGSIPGVPRPPTNGVATHTTSTTMLQQQQLRDRLLHQQRMMAQQRQMQAQRIQAQFRVPGVPHNMGYNPYMHQQVGAHMRPPAMTMQHTATYQQQLYQQQFQQQMMKAAAAQAQQAAAAHQLKQQPAPGIAPLPKPPQLPTPQHRPPPAPATAMPLPKK